MNQVNLSESRNKKLFLTMTSSGAKINTPPQELLFFPYLKPLGDRSIRSSGGFGYGFVSNRIFIASVVQVEEKLCEVSSHECKESLGNFPLAFSTNANGYWSGRLQLLSFD